MNRSRQFIQEVGNQAAAPGSPPWGKAKRGAKQLALRKRDSTSDHVESLVRLFEQYDGFRHLVDSNGNGFRSYEAFCIHPQPWGLGYRVEDVNRIIAERKVSEATAEKAKLAAQQAKPLRLEGEELKEKRAEGGRAGGHLGGRGKKRNPSLLKENNKEGFPSGTSSAYLTERMARDTPHILDRLKEGEFKSVRAAAIEAGIIVPKPVDRLGKIKREWEKLSEEDRGVFLEWAQAQRGES
jgi:hypothetical protein